MAFFVAIPRWQATWNDGIVGLGSNIGQGSFVGWVNLSLVGLSFLNPTYLPAIFVLSAKPNKMAENRTILE